VTVALTLRDQQKRICKVLDILDPVLGELHGNSQMNPMGIDEGGIRELREKEDNGGENGGENSGENGGENSGENGGGDGRGEMEMQTQETSRTYAVDPLLMNEGQASNVAMDCLPVSLESQSQSASTTLDECGGFNSFTTLLESEGLSSLETWEPQGTGKSQGKSLESEPATPAAKSKSSLISKMISVAKTTPAKPSPSRGVLDLGRTKKQSRLNITEDLSIKDPLLNIPKCKGLKMKKEPVDFLNIWQSDIAVQCEHFQQQN